jgi:hypothetical protein
MKIHHLESIKWASTASYSLTFVFTGALHSPPLSSYRKNPNK